MVTFVTGVMGAGNASAASITGIRFYGDSAAPRIIVSGTGFGATPPAAYTAADTSCGQYGPENGSWFGKNGLWFLDNTWDWHAGRGRNASNGSCIGLIVESWSRRRVALHFGVAYGSFDHWTADPGDNFVIAVRGAYWGGVIEYGPL